MYVYVCVCMYVCVFMSAPGGGGGLTFYKQTRIAVYNIVKPLQVIFLKGTPLPPPPPPLW